MLGHRHHELLVRLRRTSHPVSGEELATQLQVSSRSIRQYVKDINREAGTDVVEASHRGYQLDLAAYDRFVTHLQTRPPVGATPHERIYAIVSSLLRHADGVEVDSLAESVHVSSATIEADLVRVREVLAEFDLRLHRRSGVLALEGPESDRRRVVRQIVVDSTRGDYPAFMGEAFAHFQDQDMRLLRLALTEALRRHDLTVNEYATNDLVLHLMIAVDRIRSGHRVPSAEAPSSTGSGDYADAAAELATLLNRIFAVQLTPAECVYLERLLYVKVARYDVDGLSDPTLVDDEYVALVRDITKGLSAQYLIDLDEDAFVLNLALHVRGLVNRAEVGRTAHNPVSSTFKVEHPLVHELAVYVAHQIELRRGVSVGADEIAFLAFHIGSQLLASQPPADRVTVTCVIPRFHQMPALMHEQLSRALAPDAVLTEVVTTLDTNWAALRTDLIVSSVLLPAPPCRPASWSARSSLRATSTRSVPRSGGSASARRGCAYGRPWWSCWTRCSSTMSRPPTPATRHCGS